MVLKRYFIKLSYKGTNYNGWQVQPNGKTIQGEINNVLTQLNHNTPVNIVGCGRTDTGVHASAYYAHFDFYTIKDAKTLIYKINSMLPKDIVIHDLFPINADAHSRFDAIERTYHYHIHTTKNAFINDTSMLFTQPLDIEKINNASQLLLTHNDFECFSKVKTDVSNFNCTVNKAEWHTTDNGYVFIISANRFLRNMVRAIVGTLIEVGIGKQSIADFKIILESKNRNKAGKSVIPKGLFLADVRYPYL